MFSGSTDRVDMLEGTLEQDFLTVRHKRKYCKVCVMAFLSDLQMHEHLKTNSHSRNYYAYRYHTNRPSLATEKLGMVSLPPLSSFDPFLELEGCCHITL